MVLNLNIVNFIELENCMNEISILSQNPEHDKIKISVSKHKQTHFDRNQIHNEMLLNIV